MLTLDGTLVLPVTSAKIYPGVQYIICLRSSCVPAAQVLEGLQARLAGQQEALHRLGDALALLDMLQSLAHAASLAPEDYCRPSVSKTGWHSCPRCYDSAAQDRFERRPPAVS